MESQNSENQNKRINFGETRDIKNNRENRQVSIDSNSPEILTNPIYTPAFLRQQSQKFLQIICIHQHSYEAK